MNIIKTDREIIKSKYKDMYRCMIEKDIVGLNNILDDTFSIIHKNGLSQSKEQYLEAIASGKMNFYSCKHDYLSINQSHNKAIAIGKTTFQFGEKDAPNTSKLQLTINFEKKQNEWVMVHAVGSDY